ncbi:MAG: hypothetical protein ABIJ08_01645 [Nanoarchaeota archaeon]
MTNIYHTDFLSAFNAELYKNVLTSDNIVSDEVCKKFEYDEVYGFELETYNPVTKVKDKYFLKTKDLELLPILVTATDKFSHRSQVFKMITKCVTKKIPTKKCMELPELIKNFATIKHSNQAVFDLYKKIMLAGYFERLNVRVVSPASFGKDGIVDIIGLLNGGVANLYNATLGKLKYSLRNDYIVINEIGGLKREEISALQIYLVQAGAYKPKYENNSRSVVGTKESADLQNKSHIILHNLPVYYESKGQQYFEQMFTEAVIDRFPALLMDGWITEDFSKAPEYSEVSEADTDMLKKIIATINYFKQNKIEKAKYTIDTGFWGFKGKSRQRALRSFTIISKWLSHFADNEEEFMKDCELLKRCKDDYLRLVTDAKFEVQEEFVTDKPDIQNLQNYIKQNKNCVSYEQLETYAGTDIEKEVKKMKHDGTLFEPKPGHFGVLE